MTRRFDKQAPVAAVYDFAMVSLHDEDAAKEFDLVQAAPGGQILADKDQTLEAAGVAGAMLRLQWH
jgi:UBX domain